MAVAQCVSKIWALMVRPMVALEVVLHSHTKRHMAKADVSKAVGSMEQALATTSMLYTTFQLPSDVRTRRRFHQLAPLVPGAVKRGRCWLVPAEAWHQFRSQRPAAAKASDEADLVAQMLASIH